MAEVASLSISSTDSGLADRVNLDFSDSVPAYGEEANVEAPQFTGQTSSGIITMPTFARPTSGPRLFDAVVPPELLDTTFFSENDVPMNAMVLNVTSRYNGDETQPRHLARAALQVNPDIDFVVPTRAQFDSAQNPSFTAERERIARELGVPAENVVPVRADAPWWPQDDFMAGGGGLIKPLERPLIDSIERTTFGPNEMASELGIPIQAASFIARGGDTHVITRPDGSQAAYFSGETISYTASTHGLDADVPADRLRAIAIGMDQMSEAGIELDQIMPLGYASPQLADAATPGEIIERLPPDEQARVRAMIAAARQTTEAASIGGVEGPTATDRMLATLTEEQRAQLGPDFEQQLQNLKAKYAEPRSDTYGAVLDGLTPDQRRQIDPDVLARLNEMRDLPFPAESYNYHTDVVGFTPDGRHMFIQDRDANLPGLRQQLEFFGYEPVMLPAGEYSAPEDVDSYRRLGIEPLVGSDIVPGSTIGLNYINMIQGRTPDGRPAILMPTEASDPAQLTPRDLQVMEALRRTVPDAQIVPIGARSAIYGTGELEDGTVISKDFGVHCMSNVLPYVINERSREDAINILRSSSFSLPF